MLLRQGEKIRMQKRFDGAGNTASYYEANRKPKFGNSNIQGAMTITKAQSPVQNTAVAGQSWKAGDRASHKKWGVGTVVSVKNEKGELMLDIAFPAPTGIKRLLAKYAPIEKV